MLNNINVQKIFEKYEMEYLKKMDIENVTKIMKYLKSENIDCVDEIFIDYLDLFLIDYDEFKNRFTKLKEKYGNDFAKAISNDLNILEQL